MQAAKTKEMMAKIVRFMTRPLQSRAIVADTVGCGNWGASK
jgi:hypothetical protein